MMRWGDRFRLTLVGSSHGPEVGVEIDGIPVGTPINAARIQQELDRRRPMGRRLASRRQEPDELVIDRGVREGRADGTTFCAHVSNLDIRREAYEPFRTVPRPGHADFPARVRYGPSADLSGGGIFSGRMTVGIVIAGTIARSLWEARGVEFLAFTRSIGRVDAEVPESILIPELRAAATANEAGCPDPVRGREMEAEVEAARRDGDSVGGVIECRVAGLPTGVGEPFFGSVESELSHLLFSIPAVKGVEFGAGFELPRRRGSESNDEFRVQDGRVTTSTNRSGGILGGLTVGTVLVLRVAVKPTSSIAREQGSVDLTTMTPVRLKVGGRHDPCIVPRAVPVVEAAAAIALADLGLRGGFLP